MNKVSTADAIMESPMWTRVSDIAWRYLKTRHMGWGWDHAKRTAVTALTLMTHDQLHNPDTVNAVVVLTWLFDVLPQIAESARDDLWNELQPIVGQGYVINNLDDLERILRWSQFDDERLVPTWRSQMSHKLTPKQIIIRDLVSDAEHICRTGMYGWDRIVVRCTVTMVGSTRSPGELITDIVNECRHLIDLPNCMNTAEGKRRIEAPHREFMGIYNSTIAKLS